MPTLEAMPRDVPIIAQPEAAERIKPLGFKSLTIISPGQTMQLCGGKLQLRATAGALVGPPWSARQNGYALRVRGVYFRHQRFENHYTASSSMAVWLHAVAVACFPALTSALT
jgi:hypothetical protein